MCSESSPVLSCFFRAARVESVSSYHPLYISPTYQPGNHYYVSHFSCKVTLNVFVCSDVRVYHMSAPTHCWQRTISTTTHNCLTIADLLTSF